MRLLSFCFLGTTDVVDVLNSIFFTKKLSLSVSQYHAMIVASNVSFFVLIKNNLPLL
jgi:hypothetical protein